MWGLSQLTFNGVRLRLGTAVLIAALLSAIAAPSASADTIETPVQLEQANALEPTSFAVRANFSPKNYLTMAALQVNPAGNPCGPTMYDNSARAIKGWGTNLAYGTASIDEVVQVTFPAAGDYLICAYFGGVAQSTASAPGLAVAVSPPRASLRFILKDRWFAPGKTIKVRYVGLSGASLSTRRFVSSALTPTTKPCGNSYANTVVAATGPFMLPFVEETSEATDLMVLPSKPGRYKLCGWISGGSADPNPDLTVEGPRISVGVAKNSCRLQSRSVRRAGRLRLRCEFHRATVRASFTRGGRPVGKQARVAIRSGRGSLRAPRSKGAYKLHVRYGKTLTLRQALTVR